jgi:hypothetical protein
LINKGLVQLRDQCDQLLEFVCPEERSSRCNRHEGIRGQNIRPARRNGDEIVLADIEIDSILTPIMAIGYEFQFLAVERMEGVGDLESSSSKVTTGCS